jgi:hypothetical protein
MEVSGRANGIPFSEMGDEEQNKVKGLNDFWWPFGGQDNRSRSESYYRQLCLAGGYRVYSCMITNALYVEKNEYQHFYERKRNRKWQMNCDVFNYPYHKFILCFLLHFMSNSVLCLKQISEMTVGLISSRVLANVVYSTLRK